jgi:hypothetical protein
VNDHRKGTLKTVTPLNDFELFVTAETDSQTQVPTTSGAFVIMAPGTCSPEDFEGGPDAAGRVSVRGAFVVL